MDVMKYKRYIPLEKSWIIRMGMLDIASEYEDINEVLKTQKFLNNDIIALQRVCDSWYGDGPINVGESGTLYRFVRYMLWMRGSDREIIREGSLATRPMADDPEIINMSLEELLQLDNQTSQWASAAVLAGNIHGTIDNMPYHLKMTFEALDHWGDRRVHGLCWEPRIDQTILRQATAFINRKWNKVDFTPIQPEDYCFARAFNIVTAEEGAERWPSLQGHESNRIIKMESAMLRAKRNAQISVNDHRVVQAIVMSQIANNREYDIKYKDCVAKSWPLFWKFIESVT